MTALSFQPDSFSCDKNPRMRDNMRASLDEIAEKTMRIVTSTPERWAGHVQRAEAEGTSPGRTGSNYEQARDPRSLVTG